MEKTSKFFVKNCSLAAIATGDKASSLVEIRDRLMTVDEGCLYYHFWGGRLNTQFVHSQYHNDFAYWAFHRLHDHILAERLSIIDPTEYDTLDKLRHEVIDAIERRLDDYEIITLTRKEDQFHFIRSIIVIFDRISAIESPADLFKSIESFSPGSIFYHFIDARRRTPEKTDDFSIWLKIFGNQYDPLIENIQSIDPYFLSLTQLKEVLIKTFRKYL